MYGSDIFDLREIISVFVNNLCQSHAEQCKFYPVACSNGCGAKFERCFMDKHLTNDCPNRLVECDFCSEKIKSDDDVEHLRTCAKFVVGCPNGCNVKDLIREQVCIASVFILQMVYR